MSLQPATPIRPTESISDFMSKADILSMEKRTANLKLKQSPVHEPSPASTYGETHVGDSVPATPLGEWSCLISSHLLLYALQIAIVFYFSSGDFDHSILYTTLSYYVARCGSSSSLSW